MAERQSLAVGPQLDFQQLMMEAQNRWLRPAEICEILHNYQKFHITPEPQNRPSSGSLFLFDRNVLRYFRKDGHSWRKKKDGKTVKEAHEKLKVGSVDVLHCYYAHGEQNESFQRRSYWLLEPDFMHIVFVHYLEVKGNKANAGHPRRACGVTEDLQGDSLSYSILPANQRKTNSEHTDSASPTSTLTSLCEDADYDDVHQASSRLQSYIQASDTNGPLVNTIPAIPSSSCLAYPGSGKYEGQSLFAIVDHTSPVQGDGHSDGDGDDHTNRIECGRKLNTTSLANYWEPCTTGFETTPNIEIKSLHDLSSAEAPFEQDYMLSGQFYGKNVVRQEFGGHLSVQSDMQIAFEDDSMQLPQWSADQTLNSGYAHDLDTGFFEHLSYESSLQIPLEELNATFGQSKQHGFGSLESHWPVSNSDNSTFAESNSSCAFTSRKLLLEGGEGLQKVDSFSRWLSKELGDVEDLHMQSPSDISWIAVECGNANDESPLSPSLSQDQLFSITDFSPKWAYTDSETEVFVIGSFFKNQTEVAKINWSCMFGEIEVLAEVLADGVLSCHVPSHGAGRVPFYITCSNRVACSELREFEYLEGSRKDVDVEDIYSGDRSNLLLCRRLEKFLSLRSSSPRKTISEGYAKTRELIIKIVSIKDEEKCYSPEEPCAENGLSELDSKCQLFQKLIKEKFYSWLLHKVTDDGKGPAVLDDEGQGVIHLAAALGYDWAIKPVVAAGVSINFRDVNGWTAVHWAALCGRERTIAVLVSLGAAPGLLTDPSPEHPLGKTPADLASGNGHKGISGFLAESSLTSYLSSLTVKDSDGEGSKENCGEKVVLTVEEKAATPIYDGDAPEALSWKDSLTAVCNAKQAADRIYQVFRMQSFQRKQLECCYDEYESPEEQAVSLLASKTCKPGRTDLLTNVAATQIQKKFRGWTKRKEFLLIRQRVIKIQAHVRGHQVRKQYKPIVWSVGILEKIILRWRRKGSGLRGFKQDKKDPNPQDVTSVEDEYDFLKDGRKQTEERLQKALTRVKSMAQYPEARNQYRRLLTAVEGIRETKPHDMDFNSLERTPDGEEDMIDIEPLLDDEVFMSVAFE